MTFRPKTIIPLIIAALVLIAIGYWNVRPESFLSPSTGVAVAEPSIDYYGVDVRTIQYQADGKRRHEIQAERLDHRRASDTTDLTEPRMQLYRGTELPWKVSSTRGEVGPNGEQVELIDNVVVTRTDEKQRTTTLTSSRMTVFPERDYAETDQPVRIDAANGTTTARGMQAFLDEGRMILQSTVRGQHEAR